MDMVYKYKHAFILRDETGTCLNIEIEVQILNKFPFFTTPYQAKENGKAILDNEMKRLCHFGIIKKDF